MLSVWPSPLLDSASVGRAFLVLKDALRDRGDMDMLKSTVWKGRTAVEFPEVNLFDPHVYRILVPRPRADVAGMVSVYDRFADRPLGNVQKPAKLCRILYGGAKWTVFDRFTWDDDWWGPANTLIASSLWVGAEVEVYSPTHVMARVGHLKFEATPGGCYVNHRRAIYPAAKPAMAPHRRIQMIPSTKVNHPVMRAIHAQLDTLGGFASAAASIIACGLREEIVVSSELLEWVRGLDYAD